jgi:hypothetical protein
MTKIVVLLNDQIDSSSLMEIKRLTNLGLGDIRQRVASGHPIVEYKMYNNDYENTFQTLRNLVETFSRHSINSRFFQVSDEDANILEMNNRDLYEVSPDTVNNLMESYEREVSRQMGELEEA